MLTMLNTHTDVCFCLSNSPNVVLSSTSRLLSQRPVFGFLDFFKVSTEVRCQLTWKSDGDIEERAQPEAPVSHLSRGGPFLPPSGDMRFLQQLFVLFSSH